MSYAISGNRITLTRGDTFIAHIDIFDPDGNPYIPTVGSSVRFAMKKSYDDKVPLLFINIPIDTMMLLIRPDDTRLLPFGKYVYDIQLTKSNGEVDTFIERAMLKLTEEVC